PAPVASDAALTRIEHDADRAERAAAPGASVQARPMAEEIQQPEREGELHPSRGTALEGLKGSEQQGEAGRLSVTLAGEPEDGLHHAGTLSKPLEIFPECAERSVDVEVIESQQVPPRTLEPH